VLEGAVARQLGQLAVLLEAMGEIGQEGGDGRQVLADAPSGLGRFELGRVDALKACASRLNCSRMAGVVESPAWRMPSEARTRARSASSSKVAWGSTSSQSALRGGCSPNSRSSQRAHSASKSSSKAPPSSTSKEGSTPASSG